MKISSTGLTFIKKWETGDGKATLTVYKDVAGYLTVGYGHKVTSADSLKLGDKITETKADAFLTADLSTAETAVNKLPKLSSMNQDQYDSVVSLVFNVGTACVTSTSNDLYKALNDSNTYKKPISTACKNAVVTGFTYTKAGGVRVKGLVNRRNAELNVFLNTSSVVYITMD